MPQPLTKFQWTGLHVGNSNDSPTNHRPALALLAMQVIAEWSILEHWVGILFLRLLGNNPAPAAAMYASLTSTVQKRASLRAVAESVIKDQTRMDVFEAILARYSAIGKDRNKIAHGVWGYSENIPDGVILADAEVMLDDAVGQEVKMQEFLSGKPALFPFESTLDFGDLFVWKEIDFLNLSKSIQALMGQVRNFQFIVTNHPANINGQLLQQLLDAPEIAEVVARLRQRRKTEQEVQPQQPQKPPPTGGA